MTGRKWPAGLAMGFIATIAAVISYSDGLAVARLAGAGGRVAFLYPLLPDGLIVICLIALYKGARAGLARPRWASAGLVLGAALTLAQNVGAGASVGPLLAVMDGFVPVVFFVAAEVLIWTIRQGRVTVPPAVPARVPLPSVREIRARRNCSQETAEKARAEVQLDRRGRGGSYLGAPVPAARVPAGTGTPPPVPAGANGQAAHG